MKSSQHLSFVLLWAAVSGSLTSINEDFTELKNDLPMRAIEDIVLKQNEMINVLSSYTTLRSNFRDDYKQERTPFLTKAKASVSEQVDIDIHSDVIFVGFPASAVESVRAKWFEPLTHEDQVMASVGQNNHVLAVPGDLKVRHHFHLVQVSFQVADSIREYVSKLLIRPEVEGEESYINAWELEEVLDDLSSSVATTHKIKSKVIRGSDDTLFILNIDLNTPEQNIKYSYRNGFSPRDLTAMSEDREVAELVEKVLLVKRATRIDLPASVQVPLFDKEVGSDEYMERETVTSGTSNDRVHWRDAVSTTRDWAKALTAKTASLSQRFSLRDRALRILTAPSESPLGTHKQSLAIAIKNQIDSRGIEPLKECVECSAATWVGGGRVMFRDLHVSTAPPVHRSLGNAPSAPHPRPLSDSEWLGLGLLTDSAEKASRVGSADLDVARSAVERQLSSLAALSRQSNCVPTFVKGPSGTSPGAMENKIKDVASGLYNQMKSSEISPVCAGLSLQIQLLEIVLEGEDQVRAMSLRWMQSEKGDELRVHVDDFKGLLSRVMEEALEISNPLLAAKATQVHSGRISEQAAVYLGHLTSYVLQTVRYRVSPPMALRIDRTEGFHEAQHADHQEGGLSITALSPITDGVRRRIEEAHNELDALGEGDRLQSTTHVYTGESLLEVVLSDHAYKYRNDQSLISGSSIRGEHKTVNEAQTLQLWRSMLPSILFPFKIDIVVYIVTLQSNYEPVGNIGDNLGFDFTTFMNQISRLKLPNQQMTITVQVLDKASVNNEKGIGLGLSSCRREGVVPGPKNKKTQFYQFFDASCVWSHLHPFDEKSVIENKFKADKKLTMQTQHLPIFLLSVDTQEPTLLADQQQATVVGDMVVVLQNRQSKIQSEVSCYKNSPGGDRAAQSASGRNPLAAALAAVGEAIGGLAKAQSGHRGLPTSPSITAALSNNIAHITEDESLWGYEEWSLGRHSWMRNDPFGDDEASEESGSYLLRDFSSYLGESPLFEAAGLSVTSVPRFSTLELDTLHRARILRSIGVTRAIKRHILSASMGSADPRLKMDVDTVRRLINQALAATDASDWAKAASYANTAYITCQELHSYFFSHIHDVVVTAATVSIHSHNNSMLTESVLRNTVEEIDLEDEDSFIYFYSKFVLVCGFIFISCFNAIKKAVKYYKNRRVLM